MAGICQPGIGHWPTPGMHRVAATSTALSSGEPPATQSTVPQPFQIYVTALGDWQRVTCSLHLPCMVGGPFPGLFPSHHMPDSESVMGIKPGDSGVVIGYQVDEFTCTWSEEQFVAHSHIYLGFTGKVSSLTHFCLEPGCEDYSFLDESCC